MPITIIDREGFRLCTVASVEVRTIKRAIAAGDAVQLDDRTVQLVRDHALRVPTPRGARAFALRHGIT